MNKNWKRLLNSSPIALLVILTLIFFSESLFSGKSLYGSDFINYFYPVKRFIREYFLANGTLPFWNPYLLSGTPFISNIQASMFYPLGFLYYLIPPEFAYLYSTILHCIFGNVFMYIFMRTLSVSKIGSFISAIIFIFNGYFIGHLYAGHLSFVQNYIWIPLIFCFVYRFVQTNRFKYAFIGGIVLGIQILGGFPQIAFYTILAVLAFVLFRVVGLLKNHTSKEASILLLGLFVIIFSGFALASVQVLPTVEFLRLSNRAGGVSYAFATYDSLHLKELLSFLVPDIFGNAVDGTYWRSSEIWHFWETCGYVGILPLFLIFIKAEDQTIRSLRRFFILLIVLSIFLAIGKHNPLYPIIYRLPGFNSFRIPAQIIFLYVFGVAVVSGMGMHRMKEDGWQFNRGFVPFFSITGTLLLLLVAGLFFFPYHLFFHLFKHFAEGPIQHADMEGIYGRITLSLDKGILLFLGSSLLIMIRKNRSLNQWTFNILVSAIVFMDLYLFGAQFIKPHQFMISPTKQNIVSQLNRKPVHGRVVSIGDLFKPNDGLQYRFPSITGYDPLILKRYVHYIQSSQNLPHDEHVVNLMVSDPGEKLLKLFNLKQMIFGEKLISLDNNFPYAKVVKDAIIKPFDEVLPFMKNDEFDPRRMVVFEEQYRPKIHTLREETTSKRCCSILEYSDDKLRIRVSTDSPGYLVLSEIFYPGWRAEVDGKRVPILSGNYIFRVIPLKKGEHEVYLYFISWPFRIGVFISLLTLSISLSFIIWQWKKGR